MAWRSSCSAIEAVNEAHAVPGRKGSTSPCPVGGSTHRPVGHSEISPVHQTCPCSAAPAAMGTWSRLKPSSALHGKVYEPRHPKMLCSQVRTAKLVGACRN